MRQVEFLTFLRLFSIEQSGQRSEEAFYLSFERSGSGAKTLFLFPSSGAGSGAKTLFLLSFLLWFFSGLLFLLCARFSFLSSKTTRAFSSLRSSHSGPALPNFVV